MLYPRKPDKFRRKEEETRETLKRLRNLEMGIAGSKNLSCESVERCYWLENEEVNIEN